ncbi:MAG TPA: electron transport complex subunit RsxC [Thiobacillaceae bacterium]|nr:electron transport complex subunit RsxC [Thiobacillaceae bacterium]HNU63171.1 electron transport complex subunit RsxC [Thiobacillaceae bacterium]
MERQPRKLFHFHGGVRLDEHKAESNASPIRPMPLLARYVVPLRQHIGTPARALVCVGDTVLRGQVIGAAEGYVSTAVHAPTSGRVTAIEPRAVPHPSGLYDLAVVIEADGEDRAVDPRPLDWPHMDPSALRNRIREMGLAGLGGAVFPSYIKLNPGAPREGAGAIHTLILNGAECEPWITCDDRLMRERAGEVLQGARIMAHMLGVRRILVGVETNKPEALAALRQAADEVTEIVAVPARYPGGGGKQLTYTLTGVEVPAGGLSTDVGIQVFNVGTAYGLYRAVVQGEPLVSRIVTVTGHVARPGNYEARIGTCIHDLLAAAGGCLEGANGEIVGGPMMGFELMDRDAPVTKAVNCVIVKSPVLFPPKPEALPCFRCGACAQACPVQLQPFEMYWYSRTRDFGKAQAYKLFDCIECGCCSYVCPSHIPLVDFFRFAKSEIWERERENQAADQARARHEFRTFRLEREKQEKAEKFAKAAAAAKAKAAAGDPADPEAAKKKAILDAALARAAKAKEEMAAAGIAPKNVDNLPPRVEKEIAEIETRRARVPHPGQEDPHD